MTVRVDFQERKQPKRKDLWLSISEGVEGPENLFYEVNDFLIFIPY